MSDTPKLVEVNNVHEIPTNLEIGRQDTINTLEQLLDMARSGEIFQIAAVFTQIDGKSGDTLSMFDDRVALFGAVCLLKDKMSELIRADDRPISRNGPEDTA